MLLFQLDVPVMESTRLSNAEHDLVNYNASRSEVPPSDSDDEPMEVNPLQESSIADAEPATVDTTSKKSRAAPSVGDASGLIIKGIHMFIFAQTVSVNYLYRLYIYIGNINQQ